MEVIRNTNSKLTWNGYNIKSAIRLKTKIYYTFYRCDIVNLTNSKDKRNVPITFLVSTPC